MALLPKLKLKPQAYELDAFIAPGHWFFCRRIEIPSDLERGEEEGFALLELENLSPFPLEHLYYGYRLDERRRHAFVFAAYRRRFERVDSGAWRRKDASLPDFLVALHKDAADAKPLVLVTERSYVAFRYDEASSLPAAFVAEERPKSVESEEPDPVKAAEAFWIRASKSLGDGRARIWFANTSSRWVGQTAWFGAVDGRESPVARVSFSREEIWKADLRDPEMIEQAKKDERQNAVLWKGVVGIAALVAALILGELMWGASKGYLALRKSWNEETQQMVTEVNALQVTTEALRGFRESNLVPFKMIEALIPLQNWPKVVYRKFETNGPDTLVIDARSENRTEVTEFKRRLERFDKVASVELSNQVNNPAGSTFTTTIHFVPGAFYGLGEITSNE